MISDTIFFMAAALFWPYQCHAHNLYNWREYNTRLQNKDTQTRIRIQLKRIRFDQYQKFIWFQTNISNWLQFTKLLQHWAIRCSLEAAIRNSQNLGRAGNLLVINSWIVGSHEPVKTPLATSLQLLRKLVTFVSASNAAVLLTPSLVWGAPLSTVYSQPSEKSIFFS